ncbi:MAG: hypothetical protein IT377_15990 [Polyangiaceae bacterium]|nr:hypothetical protein [Polyangiaceae bacterium]
MSKQKWGAILALVGAFALGAVAGGFGMKGLVLHRFAERMGGPPGRARMEFRVEAMARALDLSADQRARVQQIFERHEDERRRAFEKCEPEHRALREKVDAELSEVLTPAQREKHQRMQRRHPPGGPRPPH